MSKPISIGPIRLRPHKRNGRLTGQWLADIPPTLAGGKRVRKFFDNRRSAEQFARQTDRDYRGGRLHTKTEPGVPSISFIALVDRWTATQRTRVETLKKRKRSLETDMLCDCIQDGSLKYEFGLVNQKPSPKSLDFVQEELGALIFVL